MDKSGKPSKGPVVIPFPPRTPVAETIDDEAAAAEDIQQMLECRENLPVGSSDVTLRARGARPVLRLFKGDSEL